ncbi:MAG: S41 family peptidase [Patescibacteria group bacterium]|nr:S41 family peptidase [Patescibacteria group bacterium]
MIKTYKTISIVIIAIIVFLAGVICGDFGLRQTAYNWFAPITSKYASGSSIFGGDSKHLEIDSRFLGNIFNAVYAKYWKPEGISNDKINYGAARGLVFGLGDPHSEFYPPKEADNFLVAVDGEVSGIGAEIGYDNDRNIIIVAPLPGSPAEKAGIRPKDRIVAINDKPLASDTTVDDVVQMIRGAKGTSAKLLILHEGANETSELSIIRDEIHLNSLYVNKNTDGILEISISQFDKDTPRELAKGIDQAISASGSAISGVLLDLRGNVGGFFDGAISVAGEFLEPGTIVVKENNRGTISVKKARGLGRLKGLPMVVLINKGTASAAEILAGALRQSGNATLVGITTYGKGTVQEIIEFPDGSALKVTVAEWLLPDGKPVNSIGIKPDIEVELSDEDRANKFDRQKEEALKVLHEKVNL